MNILGSLSALKDASGRMAIEKGQGIAASPSHGNSEDYGFRGRSRNAPVTRRMAGGSFMNAIAGNLADAGVAALSPYIDSGIQSLASSIRGTGNIASR